MIDDTYPPGPVAAAIGACINSAAEFGCLIVCYLRRGKNEAIVSRSQFCYTVLILKLHEVHYESNRK